MTSTCSSTILKGNTPITSAAEVAEVPPETLLVLGATTDLSTETASSGMAAVTPGVVTPTSHTPPRAALVQSTSARLLVTSMNKADAATTAPALDLSPDSTLNFVWSHANHPSAPSVSLALTHPDVSGSPIAFKVRCSH